MRQRLVLPGGKRLLHQNDAGSRARPEILLEIGGCPCLVRIDDQFGGGRRFSNGHHPISIAFAPELDLQQWPVRHL